MVSHHYGVVFRVLWSCGLAQNEKKRSVSLCINIFICERKSRLHFAINNRTRAFELSRSHSLRLPSFNLANTPKIPPTPRHNLSSQPLDSRTAFLYSLTEAEEDEEAERGKGRRGREDENEAEKQQEDVAGLTKNDQRIMTKTTWPETQPRTLLIPRNNNEPVRTSLREAKNIYL